VTTVHTDSSSVKLYFLSGRFCSSLSPGTNSKKNLRSVLDWVIKEVLLFGMGKDSVVNIDGVAILHDSFVD
jgi:hypothetical protein